MLQDRDIKTGEMEQFGELGVGQQGYPVRGADRARRNLDQMGIAITAGKLNQTQAVTVVIQAHGFGVDSDNGTHFYRFREVTLVQMNFRFAGFGGGHEKTPYLRGQFYPEYPENQ